MRLLSPENKSRIEKGLDRSGSIMTWCMYLLAGLAVASAMVKNERKVNNVLSASHQVARDIACDPEKETDGVLEMAKAEFACLQLLEMEWATEVLESILKDEERAFDFQTILAKGDSLMAAQFLVESAGRCFAKSKYAEGCFQSGPGLRGFIGHPDTVRFLIEETEDPYDYLPRINNTRYQSIIDGTYKTNHRGVSLVEFLKLLEKSGGEVERVQWESFQAQLKTMVTDPEKSFWLAKYYLDALQGYYKEEGLAPRESRLWASMEYNAPSSTRETYLALKAAGLPTDPLVAATYGGSSSLGSDISETPLGKIPHETRQYLRRMLVMESLINILAERGGPTYEILHPRECSVLSFIDYCGGKERGLLEE